VPPAWCGSPVDFAAYYDWALALTSAVDDPPAPREPASSCGSDVAARRWRPFLQHFSAAFASSARPATDQATRNVLAAPAVVTLGEPWFDAAASERIVRWLDLEPDNAMALVGLSAAELHEARSDVERALAALAAWAPGFHGEFVAVVRRLIVVKPSGSQRMTFRAASSFALWGALAGNQQSHPRWWDWVPTLVHEVAHSILFARARHAPLVENDPAERCTSPLRDDPRPIDGIYHAAFVSAREAVALGECLQAIDAGVVLPGVGDAEVSAVRADFATVREDSVRAFHDCIAALERHARLSPSGRDILDTLRREFDVLVGSVV